MHVPCVCLSGQTPSSSLVCSLIFAAVWLQGNVLPNVTTPVVEQHRGVIVFTPLPTSHSHPAPQTYYVYYMPYTQSGIGHSDEHWVAPNSNWTTAGSFTAQAAVTMRQVFVLPHTVHASQFKWTCETTYGGFQGFLVELAFRTSNGAWLDNHATAKDTSPVVGATGWQPSPGKQECATPAVLKRCSHICMLSLICVLRAGCTHALTCAHAHISAWQP